MNYLTKEMIGRSVAYKGSDERLVKLMKRAIEGETLNICFLGGSITHGSVSSRPETCYAYLVYSWFEKKFPKACINYVNVGIGGTSSQFGVTRLTENVTGHKPDFCMVEFSVNDAANPFFKETYEGVVRRLFNYKTKPALLIMNNLFYDTGENAQEEHCEIGEAYDITCISVRDAVRPEVAEGRIVRTDISPDGLHPNDAGHAILAGLVTDYLEGVYKKYISSKKPEEPAAPCVTIEPVTVNAMEHLRRVQYRSNAVECNGFKKDYSKKQDLRDLFKHGWYASKVGDSLSFGFTGSELAIQYLKTINKPAPVAVAIIDGDEKNAVTLDANFDQDWGNCLHIDTLMYHGVRVEPETILASKAGKGASKAEQARDDMLKKIAQSKPMAEKHTVEIRIVEAHEDDKSPFYLVSFIVA